MDKYLKTINKEFFFSFFGLNPVYNGEQTVTFQLSTSATCPPFTRYTLADQVISEYYFCHLHES